MTGAEASLHHDVPESHVGPSYVREREGGREGEREKTGTTLREQKERSSECEKEMEKEKKDTFRKKEKTERQNKMK